MQVFRGSVPLSGEASVAKEYVASGPLMRAALLRFAPRQQAARHAHLNSEELFYVISGSCVLHAGDAAAPLAAGDVATVDAGEPHTFTVGEEELVLLAVVAPNLDDAEVYS
jgi:quercetin dioxygenase-like cupin family protein